MSDSTLARTARQKACGNPLCSVSTGIHDGLTFGHGVLDDNGFWEFPCRACAARCDAQQPEELREMIAAFLKEFPHSTETKALLHLRREHAWLFLLAWPFAEPKESP